MTGVFIPDDGLLPSLSKRGVGMVFVFLFLQIIVQLFRSGVCLIFIFSLFFSFFLLFTWFKETGFVCENGFWCVLIYYADIRPGVTMFG